MPPILKRQCFQGVAIFGLVALATSGSVESQSARVNAQAATLVELFANRDLDGARAGLKLVKDWDTFARGFREVARPYPSRVIGTFSLEAAAAHQRAAFQELDDSSFPRNALLDTAWDKFTKEEIKGPYVRAWILAASSLIQGTGAEGPFLPLRGQVPFTILDRLEDVGRAQRDAADVALSRALILSREVYRDAVDGEFSLGGVAHRRAMLGGPGKAGARKPDSYLSDAISSIRPLATRSEASDFAVLHYAFLLQLRGSNESERLLRSIAARTDDAWIGYLARLLHARGAVIAQQEGAVSLLQEALRLRPGAASASRLLAGVLYSKGDRSGALDVLARQNPAAADPWLDFHFGEHHFWPERLDKVRQLTW